jgi:hypothetical protein
MVETIILDPRYDASEREEEVPMTLTASDGYDILLFCDRINGIDSESSLIPQLCEVEPACTPV